MTTVLYGTSAQADVLAYEGKEYRGRVRLHPEFKVLLDGDDRVVSRHADLATILLEQPVEDALRPLSLGEEDVGSNESLVIVGYGDDGTGSGIRGQRRINRIKVANSAKPLEGILLLESPVQPAEIDDRGGPCLREAGQGATLVGISNRRSGSEPSCTSTYTYRTWLREELQRSSHTESGGPP